MADSTTFTCAHLCVPLLVRFIVVGSGSSVTVCVGEFKPFPYHAFGSMEPVVRVEPNGNQALLMFDNARQDLEDSGWLTFVKRFEGFNLCVARQFP